MKIFKNQNINSYEICKIIENLPNNPDKNLPYHREYMFANNYYPLLNQLAIYLESKNILEVGVRLGYSAISFMYNNKYVNSYVGLDNESYINNSNMLAKQNIISICPNINVELFHIDTVNMNPSIVIGEKLFDMIHIDGDHTELGAYNDILKFGRILILVVTC